MDVKFYKNKETGEVTMSLLGKNDENEVELVANSVDTAKEKHVPVVKKDGNTLHVEVGSTLHPMTEPHYIDFICVVTNKKADLKRLDLARLPEADFELTAGENVEAVYAYCNLHGLWLTK